MVFCPGHPRRQCTLQRDFCLGNAALEPFERAVPSLPAALRGAVLALRSHTCAPSAYAENATRGLLPVSSRGTRVARGLVHADGHTIAAAGARGAQAAAFAAATLAQAAGWLDRMQLASHHRTAADRQGRTAALLAWLVGRHRSGERGRHRRPEGLDRAGARDGGTRRGAAGAAARAAVLRLGPGAAAQRSHARARAGGRGGCARHARDGHPAGRCDADRPRGDDARERAGAGDARSMHRLLRVQRVRLACRVRQFGRQRKPPRPLVRQRRRRWR